MFYGFSGEREREGTPNVKPRKLWVEGKWMIRFHQIKRRKKHQFKKYVFLDNGNYQQAEGMFLLAVDFMLGNPTPTPAHPGQVIDVYVLCT